MKFHQNLHQNFLHAHRLMLLAAALISGGCCCSSTISSGGSIGKDEIILLQSATQTLRIHNGTQVPLMVLPESAAAAPLAIAVGADAGVQFTAFRAVRAGEMVRQPDGRLGAAGAQVIQVEGAGPVHFVSQVGRLGTVRTRPPAGTDWSFTFHLDDCLLATDGRAFLLNVTGPPQVGLTTSICK